MNHAKHAVIRLEEQALVRWCNGDPDGFLEISADDVTYFDPFLSERLKGYGQLRAHYDTLRGKIFAPHHDIIDPYVQETGNVAVLTFHFVSSSINEEAPMRWNCTEVYRRDDDRWKIMQTHWSFTGSGR